MSGNAALEVGVFLPTMSDRSGRPGDIARAARHAEDVGLDSVWVVDQLIAGTGVPVLDSGMALAAAAAATTRVRARLRRDDRAAAAGRLDRQAGGDAAAPVRRPPDPRRRRRRRPPRSLVGRRRGAAAQPGATHRRGAARPARPPRRRAGGASGDAAFTVELSPAATMPPLVVGGMSDAAVRRVLEHDAGWFLLPSRPEGVAAAGRRLAEAAAATDRAAMTRPTPPLTASVVGALDGDPTLPRARRDRAIAHRSRRDVRRAAGGRRGDAVRGIADRAGGAPRRARRGRRVARRRDGRRRRLGTSGRAPRRGAHAARPRGRRAQAVKRAGAMASARRPRAAASGASRPIGHQGGEGAGGRRRHLDPVAALAGEPPHVGALRVRPDHRHPVGCERAQAGPGRSARCAARAPSSRSPAPGRGRRRARRGARRTARSASRRPASTGRSGPRPASSTCGRRRRRGARPDRCPATVGQMAIVRRSGRRPSGRAPTSERQLVAPRAGGEHHEVGLDRRAGRLDAPPTAAVAPRSPAPATPVRRAHRHRSARARTPGGARARRSRPRRPRTRRPRSGRPAPAGRSPRPPPVRCAAGCRPRRASTSRCSSCAGGASHMAERGDSSRGVPRRSGNSA